MNMNHSQRGRERPYDSIIGGGGILLGIIARRGRVAAGLCAIGGYSARLGAIGRHAVGWLRLRLGAVSRLGMSVIARLGLVLATV